MLGRIPRIIYMKQQLQSIQNKLVNILAGITSVLHLLDINETCKLKAEPIFNRAAQITHTYKPLSPTGKFRCMCIDIVSLSQRITENIVSNTEFHERKLTLCVCWGCFFVLFFWNP